MNFPTKLQISLDRKKRDVIVKLILPEKKTAKTSGGNIMDEQSLDLYLRRLTPEEEAHRNGKCIDYSAMPIAGYFREQPFYRFEYNPDAYESIAEKKKILIKYYNFSIIKQDRFEAVPLHIHDWLEWGYVYSGSCSFSVSGKDISLSQGQMILINTAAPHSVSCCDENDILLNFMISREYLNAAFFERIGSDNYLSNFFIEALNNQADHNNYLVFDSQGNDKLSNFINLFLREYYAPSIMANHMLDSLMTLIICELVNIFEHTLTTSKTKRNMIYPVIRYIEKNYNHCTLESTAAFFHMHPNYLSTYIKKKTGSSFKEMIQSQRLQQAARLLCNTDMTTEVICDHIGYSNTSFFFRKFKEKYNCTPREYRQKYSRYTKEK